ncbi:MAG: adenine deaminase [Candidatus Hatepunaea meridiana]|nr:adenine deaminase [Candidatus Hatepunaea meridiana]
MNNIDFNRWQLQLAAARGEKEVDLLLVNGKVINVFSGTIAETSVAIFDRIIVGFGDYSARETHDLEGKFLSPGFIEGHIHIESSKLTPTRFAETVAPHGTTTIIADPHEIANVWGLEGIRYMIDNSKHLPLTIFYMLPSCVPATSMETSGAILTADDLRPLLDDPMVLGIAELMNFPGAFLGDKSVLEKAALASDKIPIDGHAPGLSGKNLSAYLIAGPSTDHECFTLHEAEEKLACGMRIMIREGSTARNLDTLLPIVNKTTERRCLFVSDDRRPGDLLKEGHLDYILRRAVDKGLDPITAIRMVTLNSAETFGLNDRGAIKPGMRADLVVIDNLNDFEVSEVWHNGQLVAKEGKCLIDVELKADLIKLKPLPVPHLSQYSFDVKDKGCPVKVIGLVPDQIVTKALSVNLLSEAGFLKTDPDNDIVKLVVVDRHSGQGNIGIGFVKGFGIKKGAIGSTVAHDSHNIIVAGVDNESILTAVNHLVELGGGQVVVEGKETLADLPLHVAGLMSNTAAKEVAETEEKLIKASRKIGCQLKDPFMALSFLALPVIPELKLTDMGLVDVGKFQLVELEG